MIAVRLGHSNAGKLQVLMNNLGRGLGGTQINIMAEPPSPGIRKSLKGHLGGDLKSGEKMTEVEMSYMMAKHLNVLNYSILPDLGIIDHVFMDKTDTLTTGTMRVFELTTYMKCYNLPKSQLDQMIGDCKANPDAFSYEDDAIKDLESENYSEKSQEYLRELEGNYNREVFEEGSSQDTIINPGLFPDYKMLSKQKPEKDNQANIKKSDSMFSFSGSSARHANMKGAETGRANQTLMFSGFDSKDSPRDYYEKNTEMKQLNALEKKFRQAMMIKSSIVPMNAQRRMSINKGVVAAGSAGIRSPENEEESGSELEDNYIGENRIYFRLEKRLTEKNFIFDLHSKKDHLIELLNYLLICNEGSSVLYSNFRAM
jgi:hypothetical protein